MFWRRRRPTDDEFRQEIEAHIALEADRLIAEGLDPEEAATGARRTFGNVAGTRERHYHSRRLGWLDDLARDGRHSVRALSRSPGFTAAAVLTLSIGLGASTAVFSAIDAVLLRPLPYRDPGSLVLVEHPPLLNSPSWLTAAWRARTHSLADFAGYGEPSAGTLFVGADRVPITAAQVSWNFLPLLGLEPAVGRGFTQADASSAAPPVAILGYEAWRRHFNGDPAVIGRTVTLVASTADTFPSREAVTIVGVMERSFRFPQPVPPGPEAAVAGTQPEVLRVVQGEAWLRTLGRLSPGTTPEAAAAELVGIFRREAQCCYSDRFVARVAITVTSLEERLVGDTRGQLLLVLGAVGCVLLVACANLGNLLRVRIWNRERELAVRAALGAGRGRLSRLILTEGLILALLGCAAALLLTYWTSGLIGSLLATRVAHVDSIPINGRVLGFSLAAALATGLLSSIASISTARSGDLASAVKRSGTSVAGGRTVMGRGLLVAETAGTFVLVVAAVLLVQTLWNLHRAWYGFDPSGVVAASITPAVKGTTGERQEFIAAFFRDLMERTRALAGVESAGVASIVPLSGLSIGMSGVTVVGQPSAAEGASVSVAFVTPGYFQTLRTRLTAGRDFTDSDQAGAERVAIVNDVLRDAMDADPLVGKRIQFGEDIVTVVGVVEDVPSMSLREAARPVVYLPVAQMPGTAFMVGRLKLVARTRGLDPASLVPAMREAVWALRQDVVVDEVATMDDLMAATVRNERDGLLLFGVLAIVTLAVAAAGVYGAVAYAVSRRTREIGIRIALGASPREVVARTIGDGLWPVCFGIAIGLFGGVAATRSIGSLLYGTEPTDPRAFATTAVILITAALLAAWLPARRAARVDPVAALRTE